MGILPFIPLLGEILDKIFPDPKAAGEAKLRLLELQQSGELETLKQAGSIITAEAASQHWLVAAWRPITMLVFVFIIANNYILAPYIDLFFSTKVALVLPPEMWDLLKLGIGGYIVGRTGEKMITTYKQEGNK